jgi:hypothetical protein
MFFATDDKKHAVELEQLRQDYNIDLEEARLELRRQNLKTIAAKNDEIATLEGKLAGHEALKESAKEQFERQLELDRRDDEQNARADRLAVHEQHFANIKEAHETDMKRHHDEINQLTEDMKARKASAHKEAEELVRSAKQELLNAKSETRDSGYSNGYAAGLETGYGALVELVSNQRKSYTELLSLSTLAGAVRTPNAPITGDKQKPDEASKVLANAFAKHLTGTIERVMDTKGDEEDDD